MHAIRIRERTHGMMMLGAALGALGCVVGCGSGDIELAPVSGTVKRGEKPMPGIRVTSFPAAGAVSAGVTDANGSFTLRTAGREGALLGEHVLVLTPPPDGIGMPPAGQVIQEPVLNVGAGVPRELQVREESPLNYTLSESGRELIIDVDSQSLKDAG